MITIQTITSGEVHEYVQTVRLDGADYRLQLRWNGRLETWILSLYLLDGTPIVEGRHVVPWVNLLRGCVVPGKPPGRLSSYPVDGSTARAGLRDLGTRVVLTYRTLDEVLAE